MEKLDKAEKELNRSGQSAVSITALKRERLIGSAMELRKTPKVLNTVS